MICLFVLEKCSCVCTVPHRRVSFSVFLKVICKLGLSKIPQSSRNQQSSSCDGSSSWYHGTHRPGLSRSLPVLLIGHFRCINQCLTSFNLSRNHFYSRLGSSGSNRRSDQTDSRFFISIYDAWRWDEARLQCVHSYSWTLTHYWPQEKYIALHELRYGGLSLPRPLLSVAHIWPPPSLDCGFFSLRSASIRMRWIVSKRSWRLVTRAAHLNTVTKSQTCEHVSAFN